MKVGFDLDGTLDRPGVLTLCKALLAAGHEIHVISGCFTEAGAWQDHVAKMEKLVRLGLAQADGTSQGDQGQTLRHFKLPDNLTVTILDAVNAKEFDRQYRLVDLGLRKGSYVEQNGIEIMFDDSELYCDTMPSMCGAQIARIVR